MCLLTLLGHIIGLLPTSIQLWIAITVGLLAVLKIKNTLSLWRLLPPGPMGVPMFGILPFIKKEFHLMLADWAQRYGSIFTMKMGKTRFVVLSDYKLIKKAFSKQELSSRPSEIVSEIIEGRGIINVDGMLWKSQRKFLIQNKFGMKNWGSGTAQIEERISQEVHYLLNSIESAKKNPFNPEPIINCAVSNVICSVMMSTRFQHDDPKFNRFMHLFHEGFRLFNQTGPIMFLPILRHIPGTQEIVNKIKSNRSEMLEFVRYIIKDHKQTYNPCAPRDLIDSYFLAYETALEDGNLNEVFPDCEDFEKQLEQMLIDIFSAGVETVKTTLQWCFIHMLHNPEIQRKVQNELDRVVGKHRLPNMEDMKSLPYTRATIYECMRRNTPTPMGVTRLANRSVLLEGHLIPKDSHVIPLLHTVHMDPEIFENPEEFQPERFLNEEGKLQKPKEFMPFSAGQRMCPGDQLAETELQCFFASILHVYDLKNPENTPLPSLIGTAGITLCPQAFEVHFVPRNVEALIISNSKLSCKKEEAWSKHLRVFNGAMYG